MKIVFVSNYFNHHQKPVSDAFYKATNGDFKFIETTEITPWRRKMGYKEIEAPYTLKHTAETHEEVMNLINNADVVITDAEFLDLTRERYNAGKLTFRYAERLFKSKLRYLKAPVHALKAWKTRNMLMLCSSAFTARDFHLMGFYKGKTYKWGYFPERSVTNDEKSMVENSLPNSILWVGRLIDWKHPESFVYVAKRLMSDGYTFSINVIGWGDMESQMKEIIQKEGLSYYVHFLGSMSPAEVRNHMVQSQIFLFTSDEGEGWGAVLNEAMNSGCAVVASDKIGSVPFMIKDGVNGLSFKSCDWDDLYTKVKYLIDHREDRAKMAAEALNTIKETWNEETAVKNFISLASSMLKGENPDIKDGPCSPA